MRVHRELTDLMLRRIIVPGAGAATGAMYKDPVVTSYQLANTTAGRKNILLINRRTGGISIHGKDWPKIYLCATVKNGWSVRWPRVHM